VLEGPVTGTRLREIREKRTLSLDDVSRITKIPTKFLRAIEEDDLKRMPARVYLQGFVKNLATLYRLNPKDTVKSYLEHIDALGPLPNG
jgi:cytoskeletal protein RodZ